MGRSSFIAAAALSPSLGKPGQNRPYDAIVRDLIADDGLWTDKPATNFVSVTCQQDKKKSARSGAPGRPRHPHFLGLRLDGPECHNHPFAAWKKADFEGFSAFFGQTHVGFTGILRRRRRVRRGRSQDADRKDR